MDLSLALTRPFTLRGTVKSYSWGETAAQSLIARLGYALSDNDAHKPLAELWFGAHTLGDSVVESSDSTADYSELITLSKLITTDPEAVLGARTVERFGPQLPFLLKVLSVRSPLSIQTHPSKDQAVRLHHEDSQHYPDDNHKPEVALALSPVSLLYGWRTLHELEAERERNAESWRLICGAGRGKLPLAEFIGKILAAPPVIIEKFSRSLTAALNSKRDLSEHETLFLRAAAEKHPNDRGLALLFLLNYCTLQPGASVYVPPAVPHAYLSGDLVEVMANSDNVTRLGLTEKYCDLARASEIIEMHSREFFPQDHNQLLVEEFSLTVLSSNQSQNEAEQLHSCELFSDLPAIAFLLVIEGTATIEFTVKDLDTALPKKETLIAETGTCLCLPAAVSSWKIHCQGQSVVATVGDR